MTVDRADRYVALREMSTRQPIAPVLLSLALAGVLAGCERDVGIPAAGPAATPSGEAATSATACPEAVATNTYVQVMSANEQGNAVMVEAHPARRVCGGPDNGHYEFGTGTEQLTVTASATVVVLTTTPSGLGHETVAPSSLPERLVDDRFGRIFLVRGPASAVASLEEQYHP